MDKSESLPTKKPLPLSYKWLASGLVSLVLFLVTTGLVILNLTQSLDARLTLAINNAYLGQVLSSILIYASLYGREYFWIPILAMVLILGKRDTKTLAIELAALFVVGIIAGEAMKYVMYRPRPFITLGSSIVTRIATDTDSSYPSGHALIVSIGAIFALAKFRNKIIALLLTIEAAVVCYSRIYVGMHYSIDVLSGIFLGAFIVFTGTFIMERKLKAMISKITDFVVRVIRVGLFSV